MTKLRSKGKGLVKRISRKISGGLRNRSRKKYERRQQQKRELEEADAEEDSVLTALKPITNEDIALVYGFLTKPGNGARISRVLGKLVAEKQRIVAQEVVKQILTQASKISRVMTELNDAGHLSEDIVEHLDEQQKSMVLEFIARVRDIMGKHGLGKYYDSDLKYALPDEEGDIDGRALSGALYFFAEAPMMETEGKARLEKAIQRALISMRLGNQAPYVLRDMVA